MFRLLDLVLVERATSPICTTCGLAHSPGQLFVYVAPQTMIDTCELEAAYHAAHAAPCPSGTFGFHATHPSLVEQILVEGLDAGCGNRNHICMAETPGIAAGVLIPKDEHGVPHVVNDLRPAVLEVDVSGLDLFFELGEARHHDGVINARRLRPIDFPAIDMTGWDDPAWRRDHSDCLARKGLPLSRRLLNAATAEFYRRYPLATSTTEWRAFVGAYAAESESIG